MLPNPGHFTQHTLKLPLSLFKINVDNTSLSTSSAIITNGLYLLIANSKNFSMFWNEVTFVLAINIYGFSNSHIPDFKLVAK